MAHYSIQTINTKRELKSAVKCEYPLIVVNDEEFFWEMEKKLVKNKVAKATKTVGKVGTVVALGGLVFLGMGIPLLAGGVIATALGIAVDDLKKYEILFDYDKKNIVLIKKIGKNKVDTQKDTFDGFDLQAFLLKASK